MTTLKPCPFCGGRPLETATIDPLTGVMTQAEINCFCGVTVYVSNRGGKPYTDKTMRARARKKWNHREVIA